MAPISKLISFLFLTTLLFSLQINARDSQFFSKVTHVNNNNNNDNDNNVRETEVPNNEKPVNKPEQQPVFIPETENSYGLYGHESGLNPPTTTTTTNTYRPYKTTSEEDNTKNPNNNYYSFQKDAYSTKYPNEISDTRLSGTSFSSSSNNNNYFYNNNKDADAYGVKQNELSDTKFTGGGYNSMENQNDNKKYYYNNNNNNNAVNDKYYFNNNNNAAPSDRYYFKNKAATTRNNYNGESERLGMSDTRFMEGGKYFYNVNSEKYNNYNPTTVNEGSSKGVNSENWYNNRGYFGNNVNNVNKNSMGGYQNQEEFEDDQEDFEP